MLSNRTRYGQKDVNKYYTGCTGFRPSYINMKNMKLYTDHMNVLADNNELLKYIEIPSGPKKTSPKLDF